SVRHHLLDFLCPGLRRLSRFSIAQAMLLFLMRKRVAFLFRHLSFISRELKLVQHASANFKATLILPLILRLRHPRPSSFFYSRPARTNLTARAAGSYISYASNSTSHLSSVGRATVS